MHTSTQTMSPLFEVNPCNRATFWTQLDQVLHTIAHRNTLLLGGDFNSLTGHGPPPASPHADCQDFEGLIKKYRLHTTRTHDGCPTFQGLQGNSTIDFIFLRQQQMDAPAHAGTRIRNFPLASWRGTQDHLPIVCSIPLSWTCWFARRPVATRLTRLIKENVHQAWKSSSPQWQTFARDLSQQVQAMPASLDSLIPFSAKAIDLSSQTFRQPQPMARQLPHCSLVAELWSHFRALRRTWKPIFVP